MQLWLAVQAFAQPPQFCGSVNTFTQVLLQRLVSGPQAQAPLRHEAPVPHCLPQAPQLFGSALVLAHVPLQTVEPAGQAHTPPAHD